MVLGDEVGGLSEEWAGDALRSGIRDRFQKRNLILADFEQPEGWSKVEEVNKQRQIFREKYRGEVSGRVDLAFQQVFATARVETVDTSPDKLSNGLLGRYAPLDSCCQPEGENRMVQGATTRRTDPLGDVKSSAPERKSDGIRVPMSKEERGICVYMLSFVSQCLYDWTFCDSWSRNMTFIRDGTSNRFTKTSALGVLRRVYHSRPLTPGGGCCAHVWRRAVRHVRVIVELPIRRVDIEPVIRVRVTARDISLDRKSSDCSVWIHDRDVVDERGCAFLFHRHEVEGAHLGHKAHIESPGNVGGLEGCEHGEDMVKIPAHITSRDEEARTEAESIINAEFVKDIEDESAGEEVREEGGDVLVNVDWLASLAESDVTTFAEFKKCARSGSGIRTGKTGRIL
ncbi:hypothetical protein EV421DRAFT_1740603 [Armillaria borealis]|uniref:Uncharacterized protein n=1 Tax=Armillaria borealis TaxID=47425 RepID=A0AA39J3K8_9AGAR|nr:hypothetical protein EV421DRAFT_1740603 [Armillaria borealis]